jgi:signal peptidase I
VEDPSNNNSKRRRACLAGIANLAAPLGHVYVGKPLRGVVVAFAMTIVSVFALLISLRPLGRITIVLMVLILLIGYVVPIVDAAILARREGKDYILKWYNRWYMYLLVFGIVVLLGNTIQPMLRGHLVEAYKLPSGAMTPTLLVGDHILADKTVYNFHSPQRFDVVVFEFPEDPQKIFVFRVIGLPGETIEMRHRKVFINGTELSEPHAYFSESNNDDNGSTQESFGPLVVPGRQYFVLGDNRNRSYDSRFWGAVDRDKIYGLVRLVYFSWDYENTIVRWNRIGNLVD